MREAVFDTAYFKKDPFAGLAPETPATYVSLTKNASTDALELAQKDEAKYANLSPQERKILE